MKNAQILIAGCGDVGTAAGELLSQSGNSVYGLRRSRINGAAFPFVQGDVLNRDSLGDVPSGIEVLIYATAATERSEAAYQAAYVDGVASMLAFLTERGDPLRKIVFLSSTGVYGQRDGELVDEDSPTKPLAYNGAKVLEGEQLAAASGIPATAIRFGGIYGPERYYLLRGMESARLSIPRDVDSFTNRIHRDDCARAIAHLLSLDTLESCYIAVDDQPSSTREVYPWIAEQLGVSPPATREWTEEEGRGKRCSNARLKATGFQFLYPSYKEGYAKVIPQYKQSV